MWVNNGVGELVSGRLQVAGGRVDVVSGEFPGSIHVFRC